MPGRAAQGYTPWKVINNKWGLAFDAGRQALTGSHKVLIGPHLGIIVPWALYARFGLGFFCAVRLIDCVEWVCA